MFYVLKVGSRLEERLSEGVLCNSASVDADHERIGITLAVRHVMVRSSKMPEMFFQTTVSLNTRK